jgi:hypothetical protein
MTDEKDKHVNQVACLVWLDNHANLPKERNRQKCRRVSQVGLPPCTRLGIPSTIYFALWWSAGLRIKSTENTALIMLHFP